MHSRAVRAAIACSLLGALSGCLTTAPTASTSQPAPAIQSRSYAAPYDKVWAAVLAVLQDEQMTLGAVDKGSGLANGVKTVMPSTMDMMMGYSVRTLVNVTAVQSGTGGVRVSFRGSMERKYKTAEWRPDTVTDTSAYVSQLYAKLDSKLK